MASQEGRETAIDFPVVAMGASAGGLEAFERFFANMPPDSGMAFVLVSHLDPTHESLMAGLLSRKTAMEVKQAADGMQVRKNSVYIIPPNAALTIDKWVLLARTFGPDILLCDWLLPGKTGGLDVAQKLYSANPEMVIVFVTGLPLEVIAARVRGLPVRHVLTRPTSLLNIARAIDEADGRTPR